MTSPSPAKNSGAAPLTKQDLIDYFANGSKKPSDFKIGIEFERFVFDRNTLRPLPYKDGIETLLKKLAAHSGWTPVYEGAYIIALQKGRSSVTLEPGGQVELSAQPHVTIHDCCTEVRSFLAESAAVAAGMNAGFLGIGFQPKWRREDMPFMPKQRYDIMRAYMPKRGSMGLDMMTRTSTVQVNLDYKSEADMVQKMRVGLALQPIAGALFANSPFTDGKPNGFQSFRNRVWHDVDPDRTGSLPFAFESGMGFERYTDYLLDVPMYFVYRNGKYIDATGQSFRDFMIGKLPALPGEMATLEDWMQHVTCTFPNVRMKQWLEMRGADSGDWGCLGALPALWAGLIYDDAAQKAAWDLCKDWSAEDRDDLNFHSPKSGLHAKFRGGTILDIAREMLSIAEQGLRRRARLNAKGEDETRFLRPLQEIAASGKSPADDLMEQFYGDWEEDVDRVFKHSF